MEIIANIYYNEKQNLQTCNCKRVFFLCCICSVGHMMNVLFCLFVSIGLDKCSGVGLGLSCTTEEQKHRNLLKQM